MFSRCGANLDRLQTKIGEGTNVNVVNFRVLANVPIIAYELTTVLGSEGTALLFIGIRASDDLESNVVICLRMFVRNSTSANYSNSQISALLFTILPAIVGAPKSPDTRMSVT
jgi:hypothetical protein